LEFFRKKNFFFCLHQASQQCHKASQCCVLLWVVLDAITESFVRPLFDAVVTHMIMEMMMMIMTTMKMIWTRTTGLFE
jgi:hypothetical protein